MRKIGVGIVVGIACAALTTSAQAATKISVDIAGPGTVRSMTSGYACDQEANFNPNAAAHCPPLEITGTEMIRIDPSPPEGPTFKGWTGCDNTGPTSLCQVGPGSDRTITAHFADESAPMLAFNVPSRVGPTLNPHVWTNDPAATFLHCSVDDVEALDCRNATWTGLKDGPHTFLVVASDPSGNQTQKTAAFTVDATPPAITLTSAPAQREGKNAATFTFTTSEPATTECSLDKAAFVPCASPYAVANLADGDHILRIKATDDVGNASIRDYLWQSDTTAPVITFDRVPLRTNLPALKIAFSASEKIATFTCSLDGAPSAPCARSFNTPRLDDGPHTLVVTASDGLYQSRAAVSWVVDTKSPTITLTMGDPGIFTLAVDEPAKLTCSLDDAPFTPCQAGRLSYLGFGPHTLTVRADDNVNPISSVTTTFDVPRVEAVHDPTAG